MTFPEYKAIPAISASAIKQGATSMLHMHREMTRTDDDPTDAMRLGTLIHAQILEPETVVDKYAVWDGGIKRGHAWENFEEHHAGEEIVTLAEFCKALYVATKVRQNDRAKALLDGAKVEVPIRWHHPTIGACKGRLDGVASDDRLFDVKSTKSISSWLRRFERDGSDIQFGWYRDGWLRACGRPARPFWVIICETQEPWDVAAWRIPEVALQKGLEKAVAIAERYRACEASGVFPGVQGDAEEMPLSEWYGGPANVDLDDVMPMDAADL
jgi:hypothetical protein